jgi:methylmalonyl-CoA/ethylmalonyl-CoA epimerase
MRLPQRIDLIVFVVEDIEATVKQYEEALGWGPWEEYVYAPPVLNSQELNGESVEYAMTAARTQLGPVTFELVQPRPGPNFYRDWLDEHGEGFHHFSTFLDSADDVASFGDHLGQLGVGQIASGKVGDDLAYAYFDAMKGLKTVVELAGGNADGLLTPTRVISGEDAADAAPSSTSA